jgi:hypothetical protein
VKELKMRPDISAIHAAARRERAAEMHRLVFAPIAAWFRRLKAAPAPASRALPAACS